MKCECTFRQNTLGDGCRVCNPEYLISCHEDYIKDLEDEISEIKEFINSKVMHGVEKRYLAESQQVQRYWQGYSDSLGELLEMIKKGLI